MESGEEVASFGCVTTALLLAEHEPVSRGYLSRQLARDGFAVHGTAVCHQALDLAEEARPDLVLLAAVLEDGCGLDLCRRLRDGEPGRRWDRDVPVIVIGEAESDAVDRVRAFDRGADDYIGRPLAYEELLARIRARLRRAAPADAEVMRVGEITIDRTARNVKVGDVRARLCTKEYELLLHLASAPTRVFTKSELLRDVWRYPDTTWTRTVDAHASRLRRKLGKLAETPYVVNEWGIGYRLVAPA